MAEHIVGHSRRGIFKKPLYKFEGKFCPSPLLTWKHSQAELDTSSAYNSGVGKF